MADISELEESIDMELWLDSQGVDYHITRGTSGEQLNIKECPRCGGSDYKVYMNRETGLGNCFHGSCVGEKGFTKFRFIKHQLGTDYRETVEHMKAFARECGWRPKRKKSIDVSDSTDFSLPASVALTESNIPFLEGRGIDLNIAKYFNLRYSECGYFSYLRGGEGKRQDYSERVIIPIYDLNGKMVTFQGRDITGESFRKYLFPPGLPSTSAFLYNGQNALGRNCIVIGEGVFDVMAIKSAFDDDVNLRDVEAVGSFGKHLSHGMLLNDQLGALITLKSHGLKQVTFMWDGEFSATESATKAAALVRGVGLDVRISLLPPGKDPNEISSDEVRRAYYSSMEASSKLGLMKIIMAARKKYLR